MPGFYASSLLKSAGAPRPGRGAPNFARRFTLEFYSNRLQFGVVRQSVFAEFAPDPGLFEAAERRARVEYVVAIHPHRSGAHAVRNRMRLGDVFGPNGRREPIEGLVRSLDDLAHVLELQTGHHRPEH